MGQMSLVTYIKHCHSKETKIGIVFLFMAALWNRAGNYIFGLWFLCFFFLLSFFPRLISAVGDWMSTILPHMVCP